MKALVIGGTGPTGIFIVQGLLARGYDVSILHRGTHEVVGMPAVEHIHVDPHFRETIEPGLAGRQWDLVIATYGRIQMIAQALVGRTSRLISISGWPAYRGLYAPELNEPAGLPIPTTEEARLVASETETRFGWLVRQAEDAVLGNHSLGNYRATVLRYPIVYGPNSIRSPEWAVIRRVRDRRRQMVLPDAGLTIKSFGYGRNMAHAVLLAVDQPELADGRVYNCSDEQSTTVAGWVQMIARCLDWDIEICGVPAEFSHASHDLLPIYATSHHQLLDNGRIRHELGYRDVVPMPQAIRETVAWMIEHRADNGGRFVGSDPLRYDVEDRLLAIHNQARAQMREIAFERSPLAHPYPHPKQPGRDRDERAR